MGYSGTGAFVYTYTPIAVFNAMKKSKSLKNVTHDVFKGMVNAEGNFNGGDYKYVASNYNRRFDSFEDAEKYAKRVANHVGALYLVDAQDMSYKEKQKHEGKPIINITTKTNYVYMRGFALDAVSIFQKASDDGFATCCICDKGIKERYDFTSTAAVVSAKISESNLCVEVICNECQDSFKWDKLDRLSIRGRYPRRVSNENELLIEILNTRIR